MDLRVTGADQLAALAKRVKQTGDKDLRKEMFRGIQRAVKPARAAAKEAALETLPHRGGLAGRVARSKFSAKTRTTGAMVGVRITAKGEFDLGALDRGRIRHLTFGRRPWRNQSTKPGWFTDAMEAQAPVVRQELLKSMDEIARKI